MPVDSGFLRCRRAALTAVNLLHRGRPGRERRQKRVARPPVARVVELGLALAQALASARQARRLQDAPYWRALEACALAKLGDKDAAVGILADLEVMPGLGRYVDPYPLAWVHLALGNKPGALAKLREASQMRSEMVDFPDLAGGLRTDPKLDELRDELEFQVLPKPAS